MRGFTKLKETHSVLACQNDTKAGIYGGRQIPDNKVSLGHSQSRLMSGRNVNLRTESHRATLPSVLNLGRHISEFLCNVKKNVCLLSLKKLGVGGTGCWFLG